MPTNQTLAPVSSPAKTRKPRINPIDAEIWKNDSSSLRMMAAAIVENKRLAGIVVDLFCEKHERFLVPKDYKGYLGTTLEDLKDRKHVRTQKGGE